MTLDGLANVVNAAGAGPLAFLALGLLLLTYLSARWFGSERTAIRLTIFLSIFLLVCAAPILLWIGDRYEPDEAAAVAPPDPAPGNGHVAEAQAPRPAVREAPAPRPDTPADRRAGAAPVQEDAPAVRSDAFTVLLPADNHTLTARQTQLLDGVAAEFSRSDHRFIRVSGHTDRRGSQAYNTGLGYRAAQAVKQYLVGQGVPPDAIRTDTYGELRPAVPTDDEVPEPRNRRVEIRFEQR